MAAEMESLANVPSEEMGALTAVRVRQSLPEKCPNCDSTSQEWSFDLTPYRASQGEGMVFCISCSETLAYIDQEDISTLVSAMLRLPIPGDVAPLLSRSNRFVSLESANQD